MLLKMGACWIREGWRQPWLQCPWDSGILDPERRRQKKMWDYNPLGDQTSASSRTLSCMWVSSNLLPQQQLMVPWAQLGAVLILFLYSALMNQTVLAHRVQSCAPQHKRGRELHERFQHRAIKIINGWEHLPYKERLRSWGCLQKERILKGRCKEDRLSSVAPGDRTRDKGHKLKHRSF